LQEKTIPPAKEEWATAQEKWLQSEEWQAWKKAMRYYPTERLSGQCEPMTRGQSLVPLRDTLRHGRAAAPSDVAFLAMLATVDGEREMYNQKDRTDWDSWYDPNTDLQDTLRGKDLWGITWAKDSGLEKRYDAALLSPVGQATIEWTLDVMRNARRESGVASGPNGGASTPVMTTTRSPRYR
jgi:hypothetical protein